MVVSTVRKSKDVEITDNRRTSLTASVLRWSFFLYLLCFSPIVYSDCKELYQAGFNVSGVYVIRPKGSNDSLPVYCDQITEEGGWIVIQKRFDGSVRFSDRKWVDYQTGFGNLTGEFWLGLDKIHLLTKTPVRIRFDLGAPDGTNRFAVYQGFTIAGADQKYKLTTGKYIGKGFVAAG